MSDTAGRLIDHALGLEWSALPVEAQTAATMFLHDTLAVGVAGCRAVGADAVFEAASTWATTPDGCAILGRPGMRLSAPYAAFVNAYQIHAQEFDCVHEPAVAHPMATVVAVLMADAQRGRPVDGATFLTALCAGVDVVATLGVAATSALRFFRPATAGVFGSVAALCRLRRLDRDVALDAFGYALAFASGTMQAHVEGKPALAVQVAAAARSAIEAVDLASRGMRAASASIDGPYGYFGLFEDGHDARAFDALGEIHRVTELSWKPFPTGRAAHGAIVATRQLLDAHHFGPGDVESLVYRAPPLITRLVGRPAVANMSVAYARLCFAYLGAVVMMRGTVTLDDFGPERLNDPELLALASRIRVETSDVVDPAAFVPAVACVVFKDGRTLTQAVTRQFGSPGWPLSTAERHAKAKACLVFGGMHEDRHPRLIDVIDDFDHADDAALAIVDVLC